MAKKRKPGTEEALSTPEETLMIAAAQWTSEAAVMRLAFYDPRAAETLYRSAVTALCTAAIQYTADVLLDSKSPPEVRRLLEPLLRGKSRHLVKR